MSTLSLLTSGALCDATKSFGDTLCVTEQVKVLLVVFLGWGEERRLFSLGCVASLIPLVITALWRLSLRLTRSHAHTLPVFIILSFLSHTHRAAHTRALFDTVTHIYPVTVKISAPSKMLSNLAEVTKELKNCSHLKLQGYVHLKEYYYQDNCLNETVVGYKNHLQILNFVISYYYRSQALGAVKFFMKVKE